jgi:hypothetical protein
MASAGVRARPVCDVLHVRFYAVKDIARCMACFFSGFVDLGCDSESSIYVADRIQEEWVSGVVARPPRGISTRTPAFD